MDDFFITFSFIDENQNTRPNGLRPFIYLWSG